MLNGGVCNACKNSTSNCKLCGTRISNDIYIENNGYCNDCVEYSNPCFYCGATTNLSKIVSYIPEVGHYMCPYCQSQHICSNCYNIVDYIDPNYNICSSCVNELYNRPAYICNNAHIAELIVDIQGVMYVIVLIKFMGCYKIKIK